MRPLLGDIGSLRRSISILDSLCCIYIQPSGFNTPDAVREAQMVPPTEDDADPGGDGTEIEVRDLVQRYLQSKAKGQDAESGTYRASAKSELDRWCDWLVRRGYGLDDLGDPERGPQVMRRYAQRLRRRVRSDDGIAPNTARTYYAYVRACLGWGVRDGILPLNPALPEEATEELPEPTSTRADQQFWTPQQRKDLLSHVRREAEQAIDEHGYGPDAVVAARDRALVATLYFAAVRGAEVLRHPQDAREGRQGLRWRNVDLDAGRIRIFGKGEQDWLWHPLPGTATTHVQQLKRVQRPASDNWPVFATAHAPSKWAAAREQLGDDYDVDALVEEHGSIDAVLREFDVPPPALTTEGARSRLQTLTADAEIDVAEDATYLQPHGARRGMIGEVFTRDRGEAQDLGRHTDMGTTEEAYRHLDAEAQRGRLDSLIEEFE